jgi:hypothetical protein
MLGFVLGLGVGLFFGMLCHFYRVPPWFMGNQGEDALLLCRGRLERARAELYSLRRQRREAPASSGTG